MGVRLMAKVGGSSEADALALRPCQPSHNNVSRAARLPEIYAFRAHTRAAFARHPGDRRSCAAETEIAIPRWIRGMLPVPAEIFRTAGKFQNFSRAIFGLVFRGKRESSL